jgi:small-conductance mechanosensitive channel
MTNVLRWLAHALAHAWRSRSALLLVLAAATVSVPGMANAEEAEVTDGAVQADVDTRSDEKIAERLAATFDSLESLAGVSVRVRAGVVQLSGEVLSAESRELAAQLARQIEGVTAVENDIQESQSLSRRLGALLTSLEERAYSLVAFLPLLGLALVVVALFALLARLARRVEPFYRWLSPNVFLRDLARQVVGAVLLLLGVLLALELLDATALVGTVLGAAGVAGLAIGFAFRDLIENYIASVLMSLRQPFAPNDHVIIEGYEGKILRLTSRATILLTLAGNHVRIPNAAVFKGSIVNFSRKPERQFDFAVGIGVEQDLTRARNVAEDTLQQLPGVLGEPEPVAVIEALGDSSVALRIYGWVDQREADWLRLRGEAIRAVKEAFDREAIEMPEPIQRIRVEPAAPSEPRRQPPRERREVEAAAETAPDSHLDREIQAERAAEEPDLLDPEAPRE